VVADDRVLQAEAGLSLHFSPSACIRRRFVCEHHRGWSWAWGGMRADTKPPGGFDPSPDINCVRESRMGVRTPWASTFAPPTPSGASAGVPPGACFIWRKFQRGRFIHHPSLGSPSPQWCFKK
jgi:hypothetical protein